MISGGRVIEHDKHCIISREARSSRRRGDSSPSFFKTVWFSRFPFLGENCCGRRWQYRDDHVPFSRSRLPAAFRDPDYFFYSRHCAFASGFDMMVMRWILGDENVDGDFLFLKKRKGKRQRMLVDQSFIFRYENKRFWKSLCFWSFDCWLFCRISFFTN